jgi:cyclopropane fatty-acyl-phospholipid synthase-like methyltransferase
MGLFGAKGEAAKPKIPFRQRFKAWWDGYELEEPAAEDAPAAEAVSDGFGAPAAPLPPLEEPRVKLLMAIWGDGNSKPGDGEYFLYLVKPFAINETMSLLDFGCGLGGGTRSVAKEFDIYVNGLEGDKTLAEAGKTISMRQGIDKKASIAPFDPKASPLKPGQYDCIICVDRMHTIVAKMDTLKALAAAMKSRGQITITDIILGDGVAGDDQRLTTILGEDGMSRSQFWSQGAYQKAFKELKFDLRVNEDIGERYRKLVTEAWDGFTKKSEGQAISRSHPELTVQEAEYWQRLLLALDAGLLRIYRFYAIKVG